MRGFREPEDGGNAVMHCTDCRNWSKCTELDYQKAEASGKCETFERVDWGVLSSRNWT